MVSGPTPSVFFSGRSASCGTPRRLQALGRDALTVPTVSFGAFLVAALLRATEGPFEEFGWRGFALPMLQRRFSGLTAARFGLHLGLVARARHRRRSRTREVGDALD